jgi:hypothetical protein
LSRKIANADQHVAATLLSTQAQASRFSYPRLRQHVADKPKEKPVVAHANLPDTMPDWLGKALFEKFVNRIVTPIGIRFTNNVNSIGITHVAIENTDYHEVPSAISHFLSK